MGSVEVYKLPEVFGLERKILKYLGCFPNNKTKYKLDQLTAFMALWISLLLFLMMIVNIGIERGNLSALSETMLITSTYAACLSKTINLMVKKENISELEDTLSSPEFKSFTKDNMEIMKKSMNNVRYIGLAYRIICSSCILSFMLFPLIDDNDRALPMVVWTPWDVRKKSNYISTFILHMISLVISAVTNTTIDIFTCQYIMIVVGQLKIMKKHLSSIDYGSNNIEVKQDFAKNVDLHKAIIRFTEVMEKTFSIPLFIQFMISIITICFTAFMLLEVPSDSTQFINLVAYLNVMFLQVLSYCLFGHILMTNSENINEAIYMSNWYLTTGSIRKSLLIMMERCKKPIILTAAKVLPLNLMTFTWILKSSYSYFAVLQKMYDHDTKK
ncbi:hypothetical protein JTB14_037178 [Gonioctena quinquepunctata]|nr:hypothetical protein JTB14_037178 [Gonioctena quinquepunctata]